jgi:hypothetical protein
MRNDNKDRQLEKLLRLKRFEMPSAERWLEFDCAFEDKRLSAIKESRFRAVFTSLGVLFNFKRIVCSAGFCLLLLIIFTASARHRKTVDMRMAQKVGEQYVQFASDSMLVNDNDIDIQAGVCNISYPNDGIEYVQDLLTVQSSSSLPIGMWN